MQSDLYMMGLQLNNIAIPMSTTVGPVCRHSFGNSFVSCTHQFAVIHLAIPLYRVPLYNRCRDIRNISNFRNYAASRINKTNNI